MPSISDNCSRSGERAPIDDTLEVRAVLSEQANQAVICAESVPCGGVVVKHNCALVAEYRWNDTRRDGVDTKSLYLRLYAVASVSDAALILDGYLMEACKARVLGL